MTAIDDGRDEIRASIERTLAREARRNELTVGWVRLLVVTITALLEWVGVLVPLDGVGLTRRLPLAMGITITIWWALAAVVVVLLRRAPPPRALTLAIPVVDATFLFLEHVYAWRHVVGVGFEPHAVTASYGITCSLLAMSGALRLTRGQAAWSALLAMATFAAGNLAVGAFARPASVVFSVSLLVGTTLFALRMTAVVRRSIQSEVAKQALRRLLPEGVVDEAHADPLALVTTPRATDATVLATDLRGFTAMAEGLAPAEVLAFLNEIQGALARVVREAGGTVDKFIGDGMLAVFGAPAPVEDHAARALRAAAGLRAAIAGVNAARAARGQAAVRIGVGVHSGAIVTGCLGGAARLEFTIIGDTVNTAARLEALTKERGVDILISDETARRAGAAVAPLTPLGEVTLRGRTTPLAIYTLGA